MLSREVWQMRAVLLKFTTAMLMQIRRLGFARRRNRQLGRVMLAGALMCRLCLITRKLTDAELRTTPFMFTRTGVLDRTTTADELQADKGNQY